MIVPKTAVDTARKLAATSMKQGESMLTSPEDRYRALAGAALTFLALCEHLGVPFQDAGQFLNAATDALNRYPRI